MIEDEESYKKIFKFQKRWAKHWTTPSAHRAHSSTLSMREHAKNTYDYINKLELNESSYKDKLSLLQEFLLDCDAKEKNITSRAGSDFYSECIKFINRSLKSMENGEEIHIPTISIY